LRDVTADRDRLLALVAELRARIAQLEEMVRYATSVCGITLLVYEALSY
jgi:hypothetical protein